MKSSNSVTRKSVTVVEYFNACTTSLNREFYLDFAGEVTVVNGNNSVNAEDPDDILCSCTPTATGSASKTQSGNGNGNSTNVMNNNYKVKDGQPVSPYLVSAATSPRKKHTRTVMTPSGVQEVTKTLPPLDINRTVLHHHSTRRSARKSSRIHSTVPVMLATKNSLGSSKRSHSAASTQQDGQADQVLGPSSTPESIQGRNSRSNRNHRGLTASPERKSSKVLCTPERMARRGHILNKIETVRILRARPAFYPMKDKIQDKVSVSSSKSSAKSVRDTYGDHHHGIPSSSAMHDYLELPHNILGKHITLRMDRSEQLKRKHKRLLPPHP